MSKRKPISQREAVRNRRELRRLRQFIESIRAFRHDYDAHVVTYEVDTKWPSAKLNGMLWGADYRLVALADFPEDGKLRVTVKRVPEAP